MSWKDKRDKLKKTDVKWQETYKNEGFDAGDRSAEMNKNYEAHLGKKAEEIKLERKTKEARDGFTEEELERQERLQRKQIDKVKGSENKKDAEGKSEEVRKNKSWWW